MKQFIINMQTRHFALIVERLAKGTSGPSKNTLSDVDLPKCTAKNPWQFANRMFMAKGILHIEEGLGSKPVTELEFFPFYRGLQTGM